MVNSPSSTVKADRRERPRASAESAFAFGAPKLNPFGDLHSVQHLSATRAILADAQPRLAELAQARGLKLGQATVDAGAGGQGQRQQPAATPTQPQRPASAFTRAASDDSAAATDSTRLA